MTLLLLFFASTIKIMGKHLQYLSKSKYLHGLSCPKLLWFEINRKEALPLPGRELEEIFKQGRLVGEAAQKLFANGIKLEREPNPQAMCAKSLAALKERRPVFEPGFIFDHGYALADILAPVGDDAWDLIEVKASSSVKDEHYHDVAFQKYVYEGAGLKIDQCFLMHLNRDYVRLGDVEVDKLFIKEDITVEAMDLKSKIEHDIKSLLKIVAGSEPTIELNARCRGCMLEPICWDFLPEDHVFLLRGNKKVAFDLMKLGILKMADIPDYVELNDKQDIQVESHVSKTEHIDKEAIKSFINELKYPLYYLDFETISPAIPIYNNSRPFEDLPFQFSLHVVDKEGAEPKHYSFLSSGETDPRPDVLERLVKLLGDAGSIIAYYAEYERRCLRQAVKAYPKYNKWFVALKDRFVDLLVPFSNFSYYSPKQQGSASIKKVLPALTNIDYKGMTISDGAEARYEYMRVTFDKNVAAQDKESVRQGLEKYCELDTLAMVKILEVLKKKTSV